ncbi:ATP-dependent RNA helicase HrpA [Roseimaritima ulvae]|uniref:ATP-dependent RNA helicase HrpB n=1 Tax=Roseimaritima ulvae TaxID=980254 RepID=A0A5B9QWW9_9BACT|nr:ATP-dependent RNA helicase HrpA [Roseimaritima ulvae]QEG43544.1 ATP-dependent RNA helicase HrpB [Roseimaritima ulvae]
MKPASPSSPPFDDALLADRFRLRRQWRQLMDLQRSGKDVETQRQRFQQQLDASIAAHRSRQALQPRLDCPDELPIAAHRQAIVELLRSRQVIVVCGETGSGKSTQLPKFCLEAGLGRAAMIGHTQPRRLAARSIASRLNEELECPDTVGFKIRFADQTAHNTLVKLMTDGILLAETQSDRFLERYDAIIIDEAHERSLNIDFLLGYLRRLQGKRPDLRIIITSATIDAERFAAHFSDESGPAPIVNVEGRGYPVEMQYLPWESVAATADDEVLPSYDLSRHVIAGVEEVMRHGRGDALVFLPTERDIREVSHRLSGHFKRQGHGGSIELLPLYARLPQKEQQRIFNPQGNARRIVLATNVAESSLTVPRIHYVIDAGTARISRYSPRSKVQRLPIEAVSQASANQRAGRCGRIGPGVCVRLYSEEDFAARAAFTTPEIRRTNLASVILRTKSLNLGPINEFPFLDPPRPEAIREGMKTLHEIGALGDGQRLTPIGEKLGRMPVDPRVGRMLLAADENGVLPEVLVIAAAIEVQDPRERPPDKRQAADEAHEIFRDNDSDFVSYLRLWDFYHQQQEALSRSRLQKACRSRFLSYMRMREWTDVYRQLRGFIGEVRQSRKRGKSAGGRSSQRPGQIGAPRLLESQLAEQPLLPQDRYDAIHQSLLTGLLSGVAQWTDKKRYTGAGGLQLSLWPGSGVSDSPPKWIVAAELVETTRTYARTVARIQPQWLESLATHLVRRNYSEPHWSKKAGGAFCYERVNLYGLPIVLRRRLPLSPIDPTTARELLIEQGLVERQLPTQARFVTHNRRLRDWIDDLMAKARQREFVVDPLLVQQFYQLRLPAEVVDRVSLERWDREQPVPEWSKQLRTAADLDRWLQQPPHVEEADTPYMHPGDLLPEMQNSIESQQFPDVLEVGETQLPIDYHYEPGSPRDGITVTVPQAALPQVSDHRLGWLVPGLLESKLTAMIKALPKRIRRNLVPAADVARQVCEELSPQYGQVPFMPAVCQCLSRRAEMPIGPQDFTADKMPEHFQMLVNVVDDQGQVLASGRSVSGVMEELGVDAQQTSDSPGPSAADAAAISREGLRDFDIEQLESQVITERGGVRVAQFPGLKDDGDSVSLRLFSDQATAEASHRCGLTRLFAITERKELRSQVRWLPSAGQAKLLLGRVLPADQFEDAMIDLIARVAFVDEQPLVRSKQDFDARRGERARRISIATQKIAKWLPAWADAYQQARSQWEAIGGKRFQYAIEDIDQQVLQLTQAGFLTRTPWKWLQHYPRYFNAIAYRLDKLRSGGESRDREATDILSGLAYRLDEHRQNDPQGGQGAALEALVWMLQELRVSLFAQPLGTAEKVSVPRIEKAISKLPVR